MTKLGFLSVFILGFFAYASMNLFFKETNTLEFCTSCHTMQQNLIEYKESAHYKNHAGVRAICSDCHVPKATLPKIITKIWAAKDVYHEIMGTIDTPEKFEAHRWEMASRVWDKMKSTDSRECRSCHSWDAMMFIDQDKSASKKHQHAKEEGKTCIDCHKGIAHEEPDEPEEEVAETKVTKPTLKKNAQLASGKSAEGKIKAPESTTAPMMVESSTDATDAGPITKLVNGCNQCHGKDGNSSKDQEVPSIAGASASYLHLTLMAFKSGDRKGVEYVTPAGEVTDMNKVTKDFTEEQFTALSEYYFGKKFKPFPQEADPDMAKAGETLFKKKCRKCHSDGGSNPDDDAGIIAGQPKEYLIKQFAHFEQGKREMPKKMAKKFKKLDDQQKQTIIEFLIK